MFFTIYFYCFAQWMSSLSSYLIIHNTLFFLKCHCLKNFENFVYPYIFYLLVFSDLIINLCFYFSLSIEALPKDFIDLWCPKSVNPNHLGLKIFVFNYPQSETWNCCCYFLVQSILVKICLSFCLDISFEFIKILSSWKLVHLGGPIRLYFFELILLN